MLFVRAGVGWEENVVGEICLPMNERSSESFSIREKQPVIVQDIRKERRFELPKFMKDAGVVALANVPILLPGGKAYGLLQVDDVEPHAFTDDDSEFLRTYAPILVPVIDKLFRLTQLRATEQRFRLVVEEAKDYANFVLDTQGRVTDWFPGATMAFGWAPDEIIGKDGAIVWTPEDRAAGQPAREMATAREIGIAPNVRWHSRKDGGRVFIEGSMRAIKNDRGEVTAFLKIGRDATEQRKWQDRQQVIFAELQHRTNNLMAVMRRIADQTLRSSTDMDDFAAKFHDRIDALARVQKLLSRLKDGNRVTFDTLIDSELSAMGGHHEHDSQVTLEGPTGVALRSSTVQILSLAIHELCTNALKYGALRDRNGHLTIRWRVEQEEGQPWLHLDWRETGVALSRPDAASPGRGAGRDLIERALPYQLGARTTYSIEADGVHCTIDTPVSDKGGPSDG